MMNIGLFPGSFNPPHIGHLHACRVALSKGIDKIIVIPCHHHVFKSDLQDFNYRLDLCKKAFKGFKQDKIEFSDIELRMNQEKSYTIDTLKYIIPEFKEKYGEDTNIRLIMGSDIVKDTNKWKEWDKVCELAFPLIVFREDSGVSSSTLRESLKNGIIDRDLLPGSIANILKANNPYFQGVVKSEDI